MDRMAKAHNCLSRTSVTEWRLGSESRDWGAGGHGPTRKINSCHVPRRYQPRTWKSRRPIINPSGGPLGIYRPWLKNKIIFPFLISNFHRNNLASNENFTDVYVKKKEEKKLNDYIIHNRLSISRVLSGSAASPCRKYVVFCYNFFHMIMFKIFHWRCTC